MRRLRRVVAGHDVFVWASEILDSLEQRPRARRDVIGRIAIKPRDARSQATRRKRSPRGATPPPAAAAAISTARCAAFYRDPRAVGLDRQHRRGPRRAGRRAAIHSSASSAAAGCRTCAIASRFPATLYIAGFHGLEIHAPGDAFIHPEASAAAATMHAIAAGVQAAHLPSCPASSSRTRTCRSCCTIARPSPPSRVVAQSRLPRRRARGCRRRPAAAAAGRLRRRAAARDAAGTRAARSSGSASASSACTGRRSRSTSATT